MQILIFKMSLKRINLPFNEGNVPVNKKKKKEQRILINKIYNNMLHFNFKPNKNPREYFSLVDVNKNKNILNKTEENSVA